MFQFLFNGAVKSTGGDHHDVEFNFFTILRGKAFFGRWSFEVTLWPLQNFHFFGPHNLFKAALCVSCGQGGKVRDHSLGSHYNRNGRDTSLSCLRC